MSPSAREALLMYVLFGWIGVLPIFLSIPLVAGDVERGAYGFRTRKTLSDDRLWSVANRAAGRVMIGTGCAYLAFVAISAAMGWPPQQLVIAIAVMFVAQAAGLFWIHRRL